MQIYLEQPMQKIDLAAATKASVIAKEPELKKHLVVVRKELKKLFELRKTDLELYQREHQQEALKLLSLEEQLKFRIKTLRKFNKRV